MLNDTGSTVLTLFYHEAYALVYNPNTHPTNQVDVYTAGGVVRRDMFRSEIQVVNYNMAPLTSWFYEDTILVNLTGQEPRLSGCQVQNYLSIATAPRDTNLRCIKDQGGPCRHSSR
jgi:hypothetical protein